jgi:hypothetical protein
MTERRNIQSYDRPLTLAMCLPSIGMVVVDVYATSETDGTWATHHDVVPAGTRASCS